MGERDKIGCPKSVFAAEVAYFLLTGQIPDVVCRERAGRFTDLALCEIDRHDADNYPQHPRTLEETFGYYHPDLALQLSELYNPQLQIEKIVKCWLAEQNLDFPATNDWFLANLCWEHLTGGGDLTDIPKAWQDKYMAVEINGRRFGIPDENSLRRWERLDKEQQVISYRYATDYFFSNAMLAAMQKDPSSPLPKILADRFFGLCLINQLTGDHVHPKNHGELIYTKAVDIFRSRDSDWDDYREARLFIGRVTGLPFWVTLPATLISFALCRTSEKEEWAVGSEPAPVQRPQLQTPSLLQSRI